MIKLKSIILSLLLIIQFVNFGQISEKYDPVYAKFYSAEELYEKHKFSASQEMYESFMEDVSDVNNPFYIKAKYYHALCALNLYHPDSEKLLLEYIDLYPETVYRDRIFLELGSHYYQRKRYKETIRWYNKIEIYDLDEDLKPEYYFKLGYAYYSNEELKLARNAFHEILNIESSYKNPALYYYSHISYLEKNYQVALNGFEKLLNVESFKLTVPYYIVQIYYLQGDYDKVISYADMASKNEKEDENLEMSKLIGDAYYRLGKFDEATPFLESYNNRSATTRDEDYQLGYAYFKSLNYEKAVPLLGKVTSVQDELAQVASYHIAECYLKQEAFVEARNAFELAARLSFDKEIEEDALYNYALLSYKIDYNPFNEAVEAMNLYLDKYPNSIHKDELHQYLVNVYSTMKNYKAAIEFLDDVPNKNIQLKSAYQMMAYNYGVELFQSGKYNKAIEILDLVKKHPIDNKINATSKYWIAEAYYKKGEYTNSINAYRRFLEEPGVYELPMHNAAYYNIGYAYFMQEDYEHAIQSFRTFTLDNNEKNQTKLTDAFLRIGDAFFKSSDDENAIIYYQKAVNQNGGQTDYAKFQMGKSYGYRRNYTKKAEIMLDLVENHPSSSIAIKALYEVGESYRLMDDEHNDIAIRYYNQLVKDYPKHSLVKDAIFQIGVLEFKKKNYREAEKQFLRILNEFNDETKKKEAISRLKDVYSALGQPEKYIKLLNDNKVDLKDSEKDELYFVSAYDLYQDSAWTMSITSFNKYLAAFSKPIRELDANYLIAKANLKIENEDEAIVAYKRVLNIENNRFTEEAALFVSEKEYNNENYQEAIIYYKKLIESASFPKNELIANIGLMRSYAFLDDFSSGKPYAEKVLIDDNALDYIKTEANYVIGKALVEVKDFDDAYIYFENVTKNSNAEIAAESQYYLALILHMQEEYAKSEKEVRNLIKNNGGYSYWVAKALILQAKNSMGINDLVQAEYTLNSIINGYTIPDDGIIDEANEVMQVLNTVKEQQKTIDEEGSNTIEINEGGNND